jgi:hypothetical protein
MERLKQHHAQVSVQSPHVHMHPLACRTPHSSHTLPFHEQVSEELFACQCSRSELQLEKELLVAERTQLIMHLQASSLLEKKTTSCPAGFLLRISQEHETLPKPHAGAVGSSGVRADARVGPEGS